MEFILNIKRRRRSKTLRRKDGGNSELWKEGKASGVITIKIYESLCKKEIQITLHLLVIPFLPPSHSLTSLLFLCVLYDEYDDDDEMTQEYIYWVVEMCNATTTDAALYLRKIVVAWYRIEWVLSLLSTKGNTKKMRKVFQFNFNNFKFW